MTKAGFAQCDITPEIGSEMPGMLGKRYGASVHDALLVAAMVVDDGETTVALVGVDALSVKRSTVIRARSMIATETGIPAEHVMIAASHTHNGGPTCDVFLSEADPAYCARVATAIATGVAEAWNRRTEAVFRIGSGRQGGVAFNRRFRMADGTECTHPGRGNADVVEPAGPTDPEVGVIGAFRAEDDLFLGCFVNYTCHCTVGVGGAGFSADYPHYLRQAVRAVMGNDDAPLVFANGACGDVTQVDNRAPLDLPRQSGPTWGRYIGNCIAAETIKVLSSVVSQSVVSVAAATRLLQLAPREIDGADLARSRNALAERSQQDDWTRDQIVAREIVLLSEMNQSEPTVPAETQCLRIGDAALVATPAEYFCAFGLDIKSRSDSPLTYVVELANGCIGYVPGAEQVTKGEGYEPMLCRSSKLSPEAGRLLADAAVELVTHCRAT